MPIMARDLFRVSVVIYPEEGLGIAQGIQFDITARGRTPTEASERFNEKFGAEFIMSMEAGDDEPLAGVGAAPREFWELYERAKMHATIDDAPIRLSDGATPHVHQEIRIADRPHAA
jgi:hypothetical protein